MCVCHTRFFFVIFSNVLKWSSASWSVEIDEKCKWASSPSCSDSVACFCGLCGYSCVASPGDSVAVFKNPGSEIRQALVSDWHTLKVKAADAKMYSFGCLNIGSLIASLAIFESGSSLNNAREWVRFKYVFVWSRFLLKLRFLSFTDFSKMPAKFLVLL